MGNITKAEREARRKAVLSENVSEAIADVNSDVVAPVLPVVLPADDGLIAVTNGTETMRIHPTTAAAHADAGWTAV